MADEADAGAFPDRDSVIAALEGGGDNYDAPDDTVDPAGDTEPNDAPTNDLGPIPDLSDLDPAAQAIVRSRIADFQRGWTDRTTKLSDANRILQAAGGDPEAVLEAYTFQRTLLEDSDEGEAARQRLYQSLAQQYGQQAPPQQQDESLADEDPFSDYDLPPEIRERLNMVSALDERLRQFEAGAEEYAQQQAHQDYLNEIVEDLDNMWQEVKTEFPDLEGDTPEEAAEIEEEVMAISTFTNGNIMEAVDLYRRHEQRILNRLTAGSVNVPGGATSPPAGVGHSTEPVEYEDFKTAGAGAKEFLERAFQGL